MSQTQHILCPVDFSTTSEHALLYALALAKPLGAKVTLLNAYTLPNMVMPDGVLLPNADALSRVSEQHQTQLQALADRYAPSGVQLSVKLRTGAAAPEIIQTAKEDAVDLIVIGTHGRTGLEHVLLGSVAERVVRSSTVPVLTIREPRPGDKYAQRLTQDVKRILCPVDFSEPSSKALLYAAAMARQLGAELHLLHVHSTVAFAIASESYTVKPTLLQELKADLRKQVDDLAATTAADGLTVKAHTADGVPHKVIHKVGQAEQVDLIVMGTHGRTGFEHLLIGSVTERVVRTSAIPVLTVHPGG